MSHNSILNMGKTAQLWATRGVRWLQLQHFINRYLSILGHKKRLLCIKETNHHRRILNNVKLILSPSTRFLIYVNSLVSSDILSSAHQTLTLLSRSRVSCLSLGGYCSEAPAPQFRFTYISEISIRIFH